MRIKAITTNLFCILFQYLSSIWMLSCIWTTYIGDTTNDTKLKIYHVIRVHVCKSKGVPVSAVHLHTVQHLLHALVLGVRKAFRLTTGAWLSLLYDHIQAGSTEVFATARGLV